MCDTGFDFIPPAPTFVLDAEPRWPGPDWEFFINGRVHLVYTPSTPSRVNNLDNHVRFSDTIHTWSAPLRVNDDNTTNSPSFLPRLARPTPGSPGVVWYDSRIIYGQVGLRQPDGVAE